MQHIWDVYSLCQKARSNTWFFGDKCYILVFPGLHTDVFLSDKKNIIFKNVFIMGVSVYIACPNLLLILIVPQKCWLEYVKLTQVLSHFKFTNEDAVLYIYSPSVNEFEYVCLFRWMLIPLIVYVFSNWKAAFHFIF